MVNLWSKRMQFVSAALYSLGHGGNDAQKTMGIIASLMYTSGHMKEFHIPLWIVLSAHTAIAMGTLSGGWRIVKTMGQKIVKLQADRRLLRRDGQRRLHLHGDPPRRPGLDDPRHHRGRGRSRGGQERGRGQVAGDDQDRLGLDPDHPRRGHLRGPIYFVSSLIAH